jgi:hypothetical protein
MLRVAARSGNVFLPLIAGLLTNTVNALHFRSHERHPLRVVFSSPRAAGLFRPEVVLENLAAHQQMPWLGRKVNKNRDLEKS